MDHASSADEDSVHFIKEEELKQEELISSTESHFQNSIIQDEVVVYTCVVCHQTFKSEIEYITHSEKHYNLRLKANEGPIDRASIDEKLKKNLLKISEKRIGRSIVWNVFGEIKDLEGNKIDNVVACRQCLSVKLQHLKSTSNLLAHSCVKKLVKGQETTTNSTKVEVFEKKHLEIAATLLTLQYNTPYMDLTSKNMVSFMQELLKHGERHGSNIDIETELLPSRAVIDKNLEKLAFSLTSEFKKEIYGVKTAAVIVNLWTDHYNKINRLGTILHYIEGEHLKEKILKVKSFDDPQKLDIPLFSQGYYLNQTSNFTFVLDGNQDLEVALKDQSRLTCVSYLLDKILQQSMENKILQRFFEKYKTLIDLLKIENLTKTLTTPLVRHMDTRFSTYYEMFKSIYVNFEKILKIHKEGKLREAFPIQDDCQTLQKLVKLLQVFQEAVSSMEKSEVATLYLVLPYFHQLTNECAINHNDPELLKTFKNEVKLNLKKFWEPEIKTIHKAACFLHPLCKDLNNMTVTEKQEIFDYIESEYNKLKNGDAPEFQNIAPSTSSNSLFSIFQKNSCQISSIKLDISNYQNSVIVYQENRNVVEWWYQQREEYKCLYEVAKKIHAIPATTMPSKRKFDQARSLQSHNDIYRINDILFLNHNFSTEKLKSSLEKVWTCQ